MTTILFHYFIFLSLLFLAVDKFKLQEKGMQQTHSKTIYRLCNCDYCFGFWVAVMTVLLVDLVTLNFSKIDFLMPLAICGLQVLVTKIFDNEK